MLKSTGTVFSSGHDFTEFTADRDPAFHREVLALCTEVNLTLQVRGHHRERERERRGGGGGGDPALALKPPSCASVYHTHSPIVPPACLPRPLTPTRYCRPPATL